MAHLAKPGELFQISEEVDMVVVPTSSTRIEKTVTVNPNEFLMYLETEKHSEGYLHWFLTSNGERVCFYFPYLLERSLRIHGSTPGYEILLHKIEFNS